MSDGRQLLSDTVGQFFESLVQPVPRPYAERALNAQQRVREILSRLGDPHRQLPCVHIAGSKGKGSTALFVEAMLRELGYRTGTFLSPHLNAWNERFLIDGTPVSDAQLERSVDALREPIDELSRRHSDAPPSFFDALTASAFHLFEDAGVDFAIVETGLGGRYDATAVAAAQVCCITSIELEHTDKLGETLSEIAHHKAGIIRPKVPIVTGSLPREAAEVIAHEALTLDAPLQRLGVEFQVEADVSGSAMQLGFTQEDFTLAARLRAPSKLAVNNAALAIATVRCLLGSAADKQRGRMISGLEAVVLPARTEILSQRPLIIVDAAHTSDSSAGLAALLASLGETPTHLIISMTSGKQINAVLNQLLPSCHRVTVTFAEPTRSVSPQQLAQAIHRLAPNIPVSIEVDVQRAIRTAYEQMHEEGSLCVAGSVYLAGAARGILQELLG